MYSPKLRSIVFVAVLFLIFVSLTFRFAPRAASQDRPTTAHAQLDQVFNNFDELRLDPTEMLREAQKSGSLTLNSSQGAFVLNVEPFDIRTADYRAVAV